MDIRSSAFFVLLYPRIKFGTAIFSSLILSLLFSIPATGRATQPVIDSHPQHETALLHQQANLGVTATGSNLGYQWYKEGIALTGATNYQFIIEYPEFADAGSYSVVVSNQHGSATSSNAVITVTVPVAGNVDCSFVWGGTINGVVNAAISLPDGKVVIAGWFTTIHKADRQNVARLNPDGSTDHTFMNSDLYRQAHALALQPDGKILVAGAFGVVRLNWDGSTDDSFWAPICGPYNPAVYAMALQNDGKVVVGGDFICISGTTRTNIARLNTDGSVDTTFSNGGNPPRIGGPVYSLAVQDDDKILAGGGFSSVNSTTRNNVARLNADGTLDSSFLTGSTSGPNGPVYSIAIQSDGKLVIGGSFNFFSGGSRRLIARMNTNGTLDSSFSSGFPLNSKSIRTIALQNDGKVVIGGEFTTISSQSRNRIARLTSTGALDTSFLDGSSGASTNVYTVAVQSNGQILVGGLFKRVNNTDRPHLARLNSDGTVDPVFQNGSVNFTANVEAIAIQGDGKILSGGWSTFGFNPITRVNVDGSLDTNFLNGFVHASGSVLAIAVQDDGKVLLAGTFTNVNGISRFGIARLLSDGLLDESFQSSLSGTAFSDVEVQDDGRIIVCGGDRVVRLNSDGGSDTNFQVNVSSGASISSLAIQSDGKLLISGRFESVNGVSRTNIARLHADGSLDTGFLNGHSGPDGYVYSIAIQEDGKVVLGGFFDSVNGTIRKGVARLNPDGSTDIGFMNGLAGVVNRTMVYSVALQKDGKILVGGYFTQVNGIVRHNVARLNSDGSLDRTFREGASFSMPTSPVRIVAAQSDGRILVGGSIGAIDGMLIGAVVRLFGDGIAPELTATVSNNFSSVSWPPSAAGVGFDLHQSVDFSVSNSWSAVAAERLTNNGRVTVTLPITGSRRFFRLQN